MDEDLLSEPFRPLPIRAMNAAGRGLARVGLTPISLDPDALLRAASKDTGLTDFGPDSFRPGLHKLLESIESDGRLSLFGRFFARRQLVELLGHRLELTDWRKRRPEIADVEIRRPLFILGHLGLGRLCFTDSSLRTQRIAHRSPGRSTNPVHPQRPRPTKRIHGSLRRRRALIM